MRALGAHRPPQGLLALDDTGRPQPGRGSVGVARHYAGPLGQSAPCQVVGRAHDGAAAPPRWAPVPWPVPARLSLPEAWAPASARRATGRVPTALAFPTQPERALALREQARAWGVPCATVVPDAGDGATPTGRRGLDDRPVAAVVGVSSPCGGRLPDAGRAAALVPPARPRGRGPPQTPRPAPLYAAQAVRETLPAERWQPSTGRAAEGAVRRQPFVAVRGQWATGGAPVSTSPPRVAPGPEGWRRGAQPGPGARGAGQG